MAAVLVAILSLTVFGLPFVLAIDRDAPPLRVAGLAFLYGSGAMYFVMLAMPSWSLVRVCVVSLVVWIVVGVRGLVGARPAAKPRSREAHAPARPGARVPTTAIDLVTLITLLGYALYATFAPLWEWDFWAIWGLKARVFLERGGIDWRFLESPWNTFVHPDYPLLVPLNYDFVALLAGGWSDRWLGLLGVASAVALLLAVRELAVRETTPIVAALITFAVASVAISRYVGLAEGALIAFSGAGVLFLRRALLFDDDAAWRHGAICLGFAACCKNEGLAMIASVVVAIVLADVRRARRASRLWPTLVIAAPWLILRAVHVLPTDIAEGSVLGRLLARLPDALAIFGALLTHLFEPLFWGAIVFAVIIAPAAAPRREAFVILFTAAQVAIYVVTYFVTPRDVGWHIVTSWPRLTGQVAVPITFAVMLLLANSLRRGEDEPHAEARSDQ